MSQRPACLPLCAFIYVFPYRLFAVDVLGPCMEQLHSHFTPFLTVQKSFVLLSPPLLCLSLFFFLSLFFHFIDPHSRKIPHKQCHQHLSSPSQKKHQSDGMIVSLVSYATLLCFFVSINYIRSICSVS